MIAESAKTRNFLAVQCNENRFKRFGIADPAVAFAGVAAAAQGGFAENRRICKDRPLRRDLECDRRLDGRKKIIVLVAAVFGGVVPVVLKFERDFA